MTIFTTSDTLLQNQRIALVTGANSGLGYETTLGLVQQNIKVVMACRNQEKAEKAKTAILQKVPKADLEIVLLDLKSLDSVRALAKHCLENYPRLDLLINNAGIMIPPFSKTADGFESQMGVNYFSHFLLTNLLFPLLNSTEDSRVVNLSSIAHKKATINFNNLNAEHHYSKMEAYGQSKLACLMFTYELARRINKTNSSVLSVSAHPGVSNTNLGQFIPKWIMTLASPLIPLFTHQPENAAKPTLMAALNKDVKNGDYYGPTGFNEMKGEPGKVESTHRSQNEQVAKQLWTASEKLTSADFNL